LVASPGRPALERTARVLAREASQTRAGIIPTPPNKRASQGTRTFPATHFSPPLIGPFLGFRLPEVPGDECISPPPPNSPLHSAARPLELPLLQPEWRNIFFSFGALGSRGNTGSCLFLGGMFYSRRLFRCTPFRHWSGINVQL